MCLPILIKALSTLVITIIGAAIVIIRRDKISKYEKMLGVVIISLCFCFAAGEFYHSVNPNIESITAELDYYSRPRYKPGYECSFTDADGKNYLLYIDPLTFRKYVDDDLFQDRTYEISYDTNEAVIISIK